MGGFAALIGGIGAGAQQYGNQVRGFLEQRRESMASQLLQEAGRTWDPEHRSNLLQGVTDLISGVPMNKALTPVLKSYQTHEQGTQWHAQLGQAVQQAMPQPGPPQPGPPAVGQQPGTTLPADITAALPPLSPVAPEAQAGGGPTPAPFTQGLAPNSPLAPPPQEAPPLTAAIGQPAAVVPQGPLPQAGPTGTPDSLGYNPLDFPEQAYNILRNLPPGAREGMQQYLGIAAQRAEQLGLARNEMEIKSRALPQIIAPLEQMINNPNTPDMMKAMAQANLAQWHGWAVTPGATPPPNMMANMGFLRASQPKVETINVRDMDFPTRQRLNLPEGKIGNVRVLRDPWSGELTQYLGDAPANAQITLARDSQGNYYPVSVLPGQPNLPPEPFASGPGGLSVVGPGMGRFGIQTDVTGRNFYTSPDMAQRAAQMGLLTGGLSTGGTNPQFVPSTQQHLIQVRSYNQQTGQPEDKLVPVTSVSQRGATAAPPAPPTPEATGAPPRPRAGATAGPPMASYPAAFTPTQLATESQRMRQYHLAIDRFQAVQTDLAPVLSSMLESGKLQFAMQDGLLHAIVGRGVLSDQEARLVANLRTIGEDVNLVRGPLGATGFRGPEAWMKLQQQAGGGNLLRNPEITRQVLENTTRALRAQVKPLDDNPQLKAANPDLFQAPPQAGGGVGVEVWDRDASGKLVRQR